MLPPEIVHLPFEATPYRMSMDLTGQPAAALIELDDRYPAELAERRRLLAAERAEVLIRLPESDAAARETLERVAGHLAQQFPTWFCREGEVLVNRITGERWDLGDPGLDPLEVAGRLVQEDLCLIEPTEAGPLLLGGVVCFPSRWRLAEKVGRLLPAVHERVPGYAERLARPVDRFMAHVKPGRLAVRLNWSVVDDPALFQTSRKFSRAHNPVVTVENAADTLFLRVERQSLSLLPESGCVLFGIRVHVYPLAALTGAVTGAPEVAGRLAGAVRALPEAMVLYKSVLPFREALLGYLDVRAGGGGVG